MQAATQSMAATFAATTRTTQNASTYWALCGLLVALTSLPLLVGLYPPFIDYPFHLARIAMLADWNASAFIREHYEIPSLLLPNLSLEMFMLPLSKLMPAEIAGVVFIILTFALILSGTAALHKTLFGERSLWPLIAAGWLYNWIVFYGFMNYVFGVGVMLWCLTVFIRLSERSWWIRLTAGTCLALFLFFCHLVAFILYAFAIAGFELQRFIESWRRQARIDLTTLFVSAVQFAPALLVYIAISPTRSTTTHAFIYNFTGKFASLLITFTSGNLILDGLTMLLFAAGAVLTLRCARVEFSHRFVGAFIGLATAFLLAPRAVQHPGPAYVDIRVPIALMFTAMAATRVAFTSLAAARSAVWTLAVYLLVKISVLSVAGIEHKELVRAYLSAYNRMETNSTLFAVRQRLDDSWFRRFYVDRLVSPHHAYAYAAIRRDVFVPAIYTVPGGQPIKVRDASQPIKAAQGDEPVEVSDRSDLKRRIEAFARLQRELAPGRSAYVLMQDRDGQMPLPSSAKVIAAGPGFRLAKIVDSG